MIDNFEQISKLLKWENEHEFYFIQVLQRNKENPELGSNNRLIKAYYIYSLESLNKYKAEMIKLAEVFNARIMIHLNRRRADSVALEMLKDLAHCIRSKQYYLGKIYETACGRHHSDKDKTWIIDYDFPKLEDNSAIQQIKPLQELINIKQTIYYLEPLVFTDLNKGDIEDKVIAEIPTKNGIHIITKPFNSQEFSKKYPTIEIHKNNPTILFIP